MGCSRRRVIRRAKQFGSPKYVSLISRLEASEWQNAVAAGSTTQGQFGLFSGDLQQDLGVAHLT
jgi:hypothetical protein